MSFLSLSNSKTRRTAGIVGPYRYHNFGDDLIGIILAHFLFRAGFHQVAVHGMLECNAALVGAQVKKIREIVISEDLVVLGGGHILGDGSYEPGSFYQKLIAVSSVVRTILRRRTVIAGVGAGPLALRSSRLYASLACKLVSRIGVRDRESFDFVQQELLRHAGGKLVEGADVALLWPEVLMPPAREAMRGKVGIQLDPRILDWPPWISDLIRDFASSQSSLVYLSNLETPTQAEELLGLPGEHVRYERLEEFMGELRGCSLLLTSHLHLAIAAYAIGIPTVTLAINHKTPRFYEQIGHPERCVLLSEATPEKVRSLIEQAETASWSEFDQLRLCHLRQSAQRMLQQVLA